MRSTVASAALLCALLLAGCTAPSASPEAPATPATSVAAAPAPATTPAPAQPPVAAAPAPTGGDAAPLAASPAVGAASPSRSCKVDADCAVKDVGSCCGSYPMCVNRDAKTDPAAVRAQCARDGMSSTCEVPQVGGCQCVKGQCENLSNGTAVM